MSSDVFDRYAPFVQDFIYEHGWESLRGIQVAAGEAVFDTDENVLLCSSTASGKTEAAFFPILTEFWEDPPRSVGALYVAPLKALINDQFIRLNDLCEEAGIPVWHWHGDVASSHKARLLRHPGGILQITPESLEALLLHKHGAIASLFCDLRYVVIDEVHSLLRGDRGGQTLCCIERLSRMAGVNPRRIGLSATIGDPEATGALLAGGSGRGCIIPQVNAPGRTWRLSMEHFFVGGAQVSQPGFAPHTKLMDTQAVDGDGPQTTPGRALPGQLPRGDRPAAYAEADRRAARDRQTRQDGTEGPGPLERARQEALAPASDRAPEHADPGIGYIFEHTRDKKCLVFSNSREECETVTTTLRQYCAANGEPDRFLIHHGNLSSSLRESAEDAMRDDDRLLTICTTATLELGIDIGQLERAFQIDAPFTVSSFLQRMGRTGRRGEPQEMWFVIREDEPEPRTLLPQAIPWKLVQAVALVQLYLEERWVEPPRLGRLPFSLLYHQTMAELASCGELTPAQLAGRILNLTPFQGIDRDDYACLLRHLVQTDHLERTEQGGLIVGLAGERVVNSYRFYATFQENEEYTVRSEGQELGTLVKPPPVGEKIAIAGATWLVEEVDHKRHLIYCTRVEGNVPAYFGVDPGDIHTHILERMRQVLGEPQDLTYPYLMSNARARLGQARHVAQAAGADHDPLVNLGGDTWVLFPWLGTYAFLALERLLKIRCAPELGLKGMNSDRPYFIQFRMDADRDEFIRVVQDAARATADPSFNPLGLLYEGEVPVFDKYDELVGDELVRKGFAHGVLDVAGMRERVLSWR